jgi:hypothetical protein
MGSSCLGGVRRGRQVGHTAQHALTSLGDLDFWVTQHKLANGGVKSEAVHTAAP